MKFPNFNMNKSFGARALVLLAGLFLIVATVAAQKVDSPTANPAGNLDQCRNGAAGSPVQCTGSAWVNGNANAIQSHYAETQFLPYRDTMTNLVAGNSYTITLGYDILQNGKHAIDYLGTFNATYTDADPCSGNPCTTASSTSTIAVPTDTVTVTNNINPYTNANIQQIPGVFTMWNGTLTGAAYTTYGGGDHRSITVTFTANASTVVLAWGGHVAWGGDWGVGNSAGGISGSPYHMSQDSCSFGCGAQDLQLAAAAVVVSAVINVVKTVITNDGSDTATFAFQFTASAGFTPLTFSLVDNVAGTGGVTKESDAILSFGAANAITVTESTATGWTLSDVTCTTNSASSATTSLASRNAVVTSQEGGLTTCTFTNTQLEVTAAPVSISGRVTTSFGMPIKGAIVTLNDASTGQVRSVMTNSFGYYVFDNCMTDDFYVMSATAKRYTFQTQSFALTDSLANLNFVSNQ